MRQLLCYVVAVVMVILTMTADAATATKKKKSTTASHKAPAKKGTPKKGATKKAPAKKTTWRNRQLTPTPERYKEIQQALVAKGFLNPEDASGSWNQASADSLKKFQSAQNLEPSGKINSLSLIALGLGPKREAQPTKPAESPQ